MTRFFQFIWILFAFWGAGSAYAQPKPEIVQLPSSVTTGNPTLDTIHFEWYPAQNLGVNGKAPAIIALHSLGGDINVPRGFARYFASRGIGAAVMELPYHFHRALPGVGPASRYLSSDVNVTALSWKQAYADVSTVMDWLEARPDVDKNRLGATGISLGAVTIHGVMGLDPRLKAAVTFVGGGDFPDIYKRSILSRFVLHSKYKVTPEDVTTLRQVDPLAFASANRPRRVLMIQAARDLVIPPRSSQELWNALGRPPIRWLDTGHFGINLAQPQAHRAAFEFLQNAWDDAEVTAQPTTRNIGSDETNACSQR
ncbi:MAG: alpha/beta hydrolase [Cytophagaceae bacterium]|nr:MAG: alpha/beta hydrolase [Cytophagaceae bacterium]